ncbi:hypothetical protein BDZ91DRAFT_765766 [Kalaharituber pfeilii]|nr:hypothetical protein BDZ91DRAFT_765766 [Kalaharituber pfeilii]
MSSCTPAALNSIEEQEGSVAVPNGDYSTCRRDVDPVVIASKTKRAASNSVVPAAPRHSSCSQIVALAPDEEAEERRRGWVKNVHMARQALSIELLKRSRNFGGISTPKRDQRRLSTTWIPGSTFYSPFPLKAPPVCTQHRYMILNKHRPGCSNTVKWDGIRRT